MYCRSENSFHPLENNASYTSARSSEASVSSDDTFDVVKHHVHDQCVMHLVCLLFLITLCIRKPCALYRSENSFHSTENNASHSNASSLETPFSSDNTFDVYADAVASMTSISRTVRVEFTDQSGNCVAEESDGGGAGTLADTGAAQVCVFIVCSLLFVYHFAGCACAVFYVRLCKMGGRPRENTFDFHFASDFCNFLYDPQDGLILMCLPFHRLYGGTGTCKLLIMESTPFLYYTLKKCSNVCHIDTIQGPVLSNFGYAPP